MYQRLWHKEQPLGMAIADFLYVDLQPLDAHIRQIGQLIAQIDRGDCVQDCFERIFKIALFWMRKTPLFAPLTAEMERLRLRSAFPEQVRTSFCIRRTFRHFVSENGCWCQKTV